MTHPIPEAALTSHIAILGKTGSGKSNAAKTVAEQLLRSGARVCVIDPTGTWWGVRLDHAGKRESGLKPVIFGGHHADMVIGAEHGPAIAEAVGKSSTSAIIDTRLMTVGARTRFFTGFGEALLRHNSGPLHLIIDESHLFAPQGRVNDPQSGAMLHAANNLVSLGRGIGLRIILISQRPAKLHKDSLTQVETLVAMRLIAPQDRKAINDWIGEWADPAKGKEIVASLPSLSTGDAWVWSPEIDVLKKVHFPLASTFDSGKPSAQQQSLSPIDLGEMKSRLETIQQETIANDPARLKKQVADLQRQLNGAGSRASTDDIQAALERGRKQGREEGWTDGNRAMVKARAVLAKQYESQIEDFRESLWKEIEAATAFPSSYAYVPTDPAPVANRPESRPSPVQPVGDLSPSARKIVDEICAAYPAGLSLHTAAKRAGLSVRSSAFNAHLKGAAESGMLNARGDGRYVAAYPKDGPIAKGAGIDAFKSRLQPSWARMLEVVEQHVSGVSRETIANLANVSPSSSGLQAGLRELTELELIVKADDGYALHPDFLE